jgi:hypothetical protein
MLFIIMVCLTVGLAGSHRERTGFGADKKGVAHFRGGKFHDQGDNVKKIILLIYNNQKKQIRPDGGQPPGGQ